MRWTELLGEAILRFPNYFSMLYPPCRLPLPRHHEPLLGIAGMVELRRIVAWYDFSYLSCPLSLANRVCK